MNPGQDPVHVLFVVAGGAPRSRGWQRRRSASPSGKLGRFAGPSLPRCAQRADLPRPLGRGPFNRRSARTRRPSPARLRNARRSSGRARFACGPPLAAPGPPLPRRADPHRPDGGALGARPIGHRRDATTSVSPKTLNRLRPRRTDPQVGAGVVGLRHAPGCSSKPCSTPSCPQPGSPSPGPAPGCRRSASPILIPQVVRHPDHVLPSRT